MFTARPEVSSSNEQYLCLLPEGNLIDIYIRQIDEFTSLFANLSNTEAEFRYAKGKWSIKEVIGHLIDTERVCGYRLLCAARKDRTPMPSFDEEAYVIHGGFDKRPVRELLEEWTVTRQATISLLRSLSEDSLNNEGIFKSRPNSALDIACIIPAHVYHHIHVLHERYKI